MWDVRVGGGGSSCHRSTSAARDEAVGLMGLVVMRVVCGIGCARGGCGEGEERGLRT